MICKPGDVVVVPFPFTDVPVVKRRPALVLSLREFNRSNDQSVLAMITTAARSAWSGDVRIVDLDAAGLPRSSVIRWKVLTLPNGLIQRRLGQLSAVDRSAASLAMRNTAFGPIPLAG